MIIGVAKEIKNNEFRVGLTPNAASEYVKAGHTVLIEKDAGVGSSFTDAEYVAAGCQIVETAAEAWAADMVIKVKEPLESEYKYFRKDLILSLVFAFAVQLLMQLGRAGLAKLLGHTWTEALGFITTDILSVLFTMVIIGIVRRIDGLFEDQKTYLLRIQKERNQEGREQF